MNAEENTSKTYNNCQYTTYEALQQQRKKERNRRKTRQDIKLMEEGEADEQSIMLKKGRYYGQMQTYVNLSEKMKLPQQRERIYQDGLKGDFSSKGAFDKYISKSVVKSKDSSIIISGARIVLPDSDADVKFAEIYYKRFEVFQQM